MRSVIRHYPFFYHIIAYSIILYVILLSRYALFKIFFLLNFYDNPSMFFDIGIFFYVRHNIFHSFGLSLHFALKLMSNHDELFIASFDVH